MSDNPNRLFQPGYLDFQPPQNVMGPGIQPLVISAAQPPTMADAATWHGQNLADTWQAMQDPQTWVDAAKQYGGAMLMGTTAPGVRAFHGSPYDFERFDTSKIGTGEGAQAYGHGLYFAEKEGTAQSYRDALTQGQGGFNDIDTVLRRFSGFSPSEADVKEALTGHSTLASLADNPAVVDAVRRLSPDYNPSGAVTGDALRHYRTINDAIEASTPKGSMYEVNIAADPEHFLHWDKPLPEQSPDVLAKLRPLLQPTYERQAYATGTSVDAARDALESTMNGRLAYQELSHPSTDQSVTLPVRQQRAAEALQAAGIPGIRYLDQGSRGQGQGTHNYVVFDANTIDILRKYGIAGLIAGGGAAAAGSQQPSQ